MGRVWAARRTDGGGYGPTHGPGAVWTEDRFWALFLRMSAEGFRPGKVGIGGRAFGAYFGRKFGHGRRVSVERTMRPKLVSGRARLAGAFLNPSPREGARHAGHNLSKGKIEKIRYVRDQTSGTGRTRKQERKGPCHRSDTRADTQRARHTRARSNTQADEQTARHTKQRYFRHTRPDRKRSTRHIREQAHKRDGAIL